MSTSPRRIRGIEGLRGVAACSILFYHAWLLGSVAETRGSNLGPLTAFVPPLQSGVTLFFVLSGFLLYRPIAGSVIDDRRLPSVGRYLRNRALRILPAYWTILLVTWFVLGTAVLKVASGGVLIGSQSDVGLLAKNALLVADYRPETMWTGIAPAWSLAVEVVFYLILPLLALLAVALARRGLGPRGRVRAAVAPAAVLFTIALCGKVAAVWLLSGPGRSSGSDWHTVLDRSLLTHADLFAFGMLAAVVLVCADAGLLRIPAALLGGVGGRFLLYFGLPFAVFGYYLVSPYLYDAVLALSLAVLLVRIVVSGATAEPAGLLRFLERPTTIRIGLASYSIFLWNYPILAFLKFHHLLLPEGNAGAVLVNIAIAATITITLSFATYRYVEAPFLRMKSLSRPRDVLTTAQSRVRARLRTSRSES